MTGYDVELKLLTLSELGHDRRREYGVNFRHVSTTSNQLFRLTQMHCAPNQPQITSNTARDRRTKRNKKKARLMSDASKTRNGKKTSSTFFSQNSQTFKTHTLRKPTASNLNGRTSFYDYKTKEIYTQSQHDHKSVRDFFHF